MCLKEIFYIKVEDSPEGLQQKCIQLAAAIKQANYVVLYTGAGISTVSKNDM